MENSKASRPRPENQACLPKGHDVLNDAKEIFLAALEKPKRERPAFVEEACARDERLRRRVKALLEAHDEPDSLLDQERIDPRLSADSGNALDATIDLPATEKPGTQIPKPLWRSAAKLQHRRGFVHSVNRR